MMGKLFDLNVLLQRQDAFFDRGRASPFSLFRLKRVAAPAGHPDYEFWQEPQAKYVRK